MKWNRKQMAWMRKAAKGRVTVARACAPPDENFAPRYWPRVAGTYVSVTGRPKTGYLTHADAEAAGLQYREECRAALAAVTATPNR